MAADRTESLASWYLRFNGYFVIPGFTVHPDYKKRPGGTDADVLAVRFKHSREYQVRFNFERDPSLVLDIGMDFVIAEVKRSKCSLNDTWTKAERENVEYALRWMGRWEDQAIRTIASRMYRNGHWQNRRRGESVRFLCFGSESNQEFADKWPDIPQFTLHHATSYLRDRMRKGCLQTNRTMWDPFAQEVGKRFDAGETVEQVLAWIVR
jgi:hypothetical protein